jgi:hypothetical protein
MFLFGCAIVIFVAWVYVVFVRPRLAANYPATFEKIDAIELKLWSASRTILFARLYWVGGLVIGAHDLIAQAGADWTPLVNEAAAFIPERYRPLALAAFLFGTGVLYEWLRRITTTPVAEKE